MLTESRIRAIEKALNQRAAAGAAAVAKRQADAAFAAKLATASADVVPPRHEEDCTCAWCAPYRDVSGPRCDGPADGQGACMWCMRCREIVRAGWPAAARKRVR